MSYNPQPQRSAMFSLSLGGSVTISNGTTLAIITNSGLLATGTIVLPPNPTDGMPLSINSPNGVTLLTLTPNTGQTISGPTISALVSSVPIRLKYCNLNQTWYPN